MEVGDAGIVWELGGFLLLLLTTDRYDPVKPYYRQEKGEMKKEVEGFYDKIRNKAVPFKFVRGLQITGMLFVCAGLILQFSPFN